MATDHIMIIRHAEKPKHGMAGVNEAGTWDNNSLSVRGWQRAGALVRYFAPKKLAAFAQGIATPTALYAAASSPRRPSTRSLNTLQPLAADLALPINQRLSVNDPLDKLLAAVLAEAGPVLICWRHGGIPKIGKALAGAGAGLPDLWPSERFDLVWNFQRAGDQWTFTEIEQHVLPA